MAPASYDSLLAAIYDAPLQPDGWTRAIELLTQALGGRGTTLLFQDRAPGRAPIRLVAITGYPDEAEGIYNEHFLHQDDRLVQVMASPVGQLLADERDLDHDAYRTTPIFNDFYRRYGLECGVGTKLIADPDRLGLISIFRELGRGSYSDEEMQLMQRITPHLVRALQIKRRLDRADTLAAGLLSGLDQFDQAVLLLDPEGRVVERNRAAELLLSQPDCPLSIREHRLFTPRPADADALRRIVAAASPALQGGAPPAVLRLVSHSGLTTLGLMTVPVRRGDLLRATDPSGTLVFVAGPAQGGRVDPTILARQFGLSTAEAQVAAALAMGGTINDIADHRQVSRETVRVQVKHVMAKTGLNSQSRLVALLTRSLASLRGF